MIVVAMLGCLWESREKQEMQIRTCGDKKLRVENGPEMDEKSENSDVDAVSLNSAGGDVGLTGFAERMV